jgi:hypothetical protein
MSEQKLKDIKQWLSIEGMTGHFMPDENPVQQMAIAIVYGMESGEEYIRLKDIIEEKKGHIDEGN